MQTLKTRFLRKKINKNVKTLNNKRCLQNHFGLITKIRPPNKTISYMAVWLTFN